MQNLVPHGRMACDRCWQTSEISRELGSFKLVRDPGHWGSSNPATLVLGLSKGQTQSSAYASGDFDGVAFKGIRSRLLQGLQSVGLLSSESPVRFEQRFLISEEDYAFASVVRCSLTGFDKRKGKHTADSPNVIPAFKADSPGHAFASACVDHHLGKLPPRTRTVILLGNTDTYVANLRGLIARTLSNVTQINEIAYRTDQVLFAHISHPSKGNGHFGAFIRGEGRPGEKMRLARAALNK